MPSTKCDELSYPTHLKSRGSVIRNDFLEYRTKQATLFERLNELYALLATNKPRHILNKHLSCSCSAIIYHKSIKINRKSPIF